VYGMSAEPISQREFDAYVRASAETNKTTSRAVLAIQKSGQETNNLLKELVIQNNHWQAGTDKEIKAMKVDIVDLKEKAKAGLSIDKFWLTIKKYLIYALIGAVTVIGGYYGNKIVNPEKQEAKKVVIQ